MELSSLFRRSRKSPDLPIETAVLPPAAGWEQPAPENEPAVGTLDATGFVTYSWLLDPRKQIIGYRFGWAPLRRHARADAHTRLQAVVSAIEQGFVDRHRGWTMAKTGLMFDVTCESVAAIDWGALPCKNIVLCWQSEEFCRPESLPLLKELRESGFGHMLSGDVPEDNEARGLITHFDVGAGDALSVVSCRSIQRRPVLPVATRMENWPGFDWCATRRVPVLVNPGQKPPTVASGKVLEPETMLIIRLLQMIQRNEDIREIEAALKHDAAITCRFLEHINSPAVSGGVQIESLRHAVAMLGYQRLFRWLSVLLTTTDMKSRPAYLMKKAIIRGRFVELLGHVLLGPQHADNLFLAGMFSVIEELLGVPMTQLLEKVQLNEAVQLAILEQKGIYGPFLAIPLAIERGGSDAEPLVEALLMSATQVNAAHLSAISWSAEISRPEAMY